MGQIIGLDLAEGSHFNELLFFVLHYNSTLILYKGLLSRTQYRYSIDAYYIEMTISGSEVEKYARNMLDKYGLHDWKFSWNRGKRLAGLCNYQLKTVFLSTYMLTKNAVEFNDIRNTLLHEIAHALTPGHNHDHVWVQKALEIGCDGKRCHSLGQLDKACWKISCACGACKAERFRISSKIKHSICRHCKSKLKIMRS